jgi:hypothetical protein
MRARLTISAASSIELPKEPLDPEPQVFFRGNYDFLQGQLAAQLAAN